MILSPCLACRRTARVPSMPAVARRLLLLLVAAMVTLASCGGGGSPTLAKHPSRTPSRVSTVPATFSQVAQPVGSTLGIYPSPLAAAPSQTYPNPWRLDDDPRYPVAQVFLVTRRAGDWLQVLLPVRPNGTTGWVRAADVHVTLDPYRVKVELGARQVTVLDGATVVVRGPTAVGAPATPSPLGLYYLRVLLRAADPNTVYGPYAFGLSGHSDVLTSFNGGDGELGLHGNNDASVLGKDITHGCIRMANDAITKLAGLLPLGTPVEIDP
jgi:lipoprotein-anchoring transpeptidase ErfK/SrfK